MLNNRTSAARTRIAIGQALLLSLAGVLVLPATVAEAATIVTATYGYTGSTAAFTVPPGVTTITVTVTGGQGGSGGRDYAATTTGGYQGVVTGIVAVTPGEVLTVAVGGGGTNGFQGGSAAGGNGGLNPLPGYDGAVGGIAGPEGSSGGGGGSGAASVLIVDATAIVAGGAGGNGGNGQFQAIVGRRAEGTHTPRADEATTTGRPGVDTVTMCSVGVRCDGGASGAGGGGAVGGERGAVQYGGSTATEYFGFGGYPGANSIAAHEGLAASYDYYAANNASGSITISYDDGAPSAPLNLAATVATGAIGVAWNAPASSGSSAISDYRVEHATNPAGPFTTFEDGVSTGLTTVVTGLLNGTTYYFRVSAINAEGPGATATTTIGVVPSDVPASPTVTGLVPFGSGIHVDFAAGTSDSPVTGYEYRLDGGTWTSGAVASSRLTITGLTNGHSYSVEIRALNTIGAGAPSSPAVSATPIDVAQAPSDVLLVAADGSIGVTWAAPTLDNGAPITDYIVQRAVAIGGPYVESVDGTSVVTSATIGDLTNGTPYYVRVAAVNAAGVGAWSTVAVATPFGIPGAPSVLLTPGDGALAVDIAQGFDGGSVVTGFEYRLGTGGVWRSTGSAATSFTIAGLTNATSYEVFVRAINAAGVGPASVGVSGTPRTVPAAPAIAAVALDTGAVSVSFTVGSDGGSPLTNVEYSLDDGITWVTRAPASGDSPLTIGGLVGGQTYPVRLRVVNAVGFSERSNASSVTAKGTPKAPTVVVDAAAGALVVTFSTPANGGTPITNYEYSIDGGNTWATRSPAATSTPLYIGGLVNGTEYLVRLRAVNAVGSGTESAAVAGVPRTVPGAPSIDAATIVGVNGQLDVAFTAPGSNGGSPIVTYQYSTDAGATWLGRQTGSTESPLLITVASDGTSPLVGGERYPVELRAVNAAGPGVASAVADGITTSVPGTPVIGSIAGGDASASVRFTAPANGGSAITRFEYRLDGGTWFDTGSLADEFIVGGLTNSTTYTLELRAVNDVGVGTASAPHMVQVFTAPGPPALAAIVPGDQTLAVGFTPGADGGRGIIDYEYSTDGGATWRTGDSTVSPILITTESAVGAQALTNGEVYAVQLRAINSAGPGAASETRLAAPRGTPSAPTALAVAGGDASLELTFTAAADGGSPITSVEYRIDDGEWVGAGSLNSPFTVGGLANGTEYSVSVRARNAVGAGAASTNASGTPRTLPGSPTAVVSSTGSHEVTVGWGAPEFDGGAAVTGYTVSVYEQVSGGAAIATCTTAALTCTVTGLTNGTTVYADVTAENAAGAGQPSLRTPQTPLAAPRVTIASISPLAEGLSVAVDIADGGGAPISAYEYSLDGGTWRPAPTATSPFTIPDLTTGVSYSVRIRAISAGGIGDASPAVSAVPHAAPGAPTGLSATRGPASAVLSWTAPEIDGGQPVTDYVVQYAVSAAGPFTTFADGTSALEAATVTGLLNATTYFFRVAALNTAGVGLWSSLASATPLAAPSAPTISTVTPGSGFLTVAFTAPSSNGGSVVTGYEYRLDGGSWRSRSGTSSPIAIAGLNNGQTYGVQLRAVNAVGGGTASALVSAKPYGLPAGVVGFRASPGIGDVTLAWDAVDDNGSPITAYNLIRWSLAAEGTIAASFQTTATTHTFTGLGDGIYYFTVEATNLAGTGSRSAPRTSAIVGSTVPSAPTAVSTSIDHSAATLAWTAGAAGTSAISGHIVQYSTDEITWTTLSSGSGAASAQFGLPSTTAPYSLRVAAVSASGVGAFATTRPLIAATGAMSGVGTTAATVAGSINANTGTAGAAFEYATTASGFDTGAATIVEASPVSVTGVADAAVTATLTGLSPGTSYVVRTVASGSAGVTRGATRTFTTDAVIVSSDLSPIYTGSPVVIETVTVPAALVIEREFEGVDGTVYPTSSTPPTGVGSYRVTTVPADDTFGGEEIAVVTIVPKPMTVAVTVSARPYDATTSAELTLGLVGVVAGDDVTVDPSQVSGAFADAGAGIDKIVTITSRSPLLTGADAANYVASIAGEVVATIVKATQTLTFTSAAPSPATVGATYVPVVVSSAGLTHSLAVGQGDGTVCSTSVGVVSLLSVGTCVVVATQVGTNDIEAAGAVEQTLLVIDPALPQTITVDGLRDVALDDGPLVLPAATPADMPLTYTAGPAGVCSVTGATVVLHGVGTCTVTANQAGDAAWLPATASGSFDVSRIVQLIALPELDDVALGAGRVELPAVTPDDMPLTYTAGPAGVCTVAGRIVSLRGIGTCIVTAAQAGTATHAPASATTSFDVLPTALVVSLELRAGADIAGARVAVRGDGLEPNSEVRIELRSPTVLLGTAVTDAHGSLDTTVRLPSEVSAGTHHIVAIGTRADGRTVTTSEEVFVDWSGALGDVATITGYTPLTATRIMDSRDSGRSMKAATEHRLAVPSALVPADVSALVLNLTVTEAASDGYITIHPCGTPRPLAAAVNFTRRETKANLVDIRFFAGDELCLWSNVDTHAVIDLQGFHSESSENHLVPRTAVRLVDTRPSDALAKGRTLAVQVIGGGRAAADTTAVALNVAVDDPQRAGFLTVYPCGSERPSTSNVNFQAGQTVSNEVLVEPGVDGNVCVYATATTQLVVDLNATYDASGDQSFVALVPGRLADTRVTKKVPAGGTVEWVVAGGPGTTALSLNIAATETEAPGFLTVFPCGEGMPLASNVNFAAGETMSNHVTATVGENGKICVFASSRTHVVIDVEGIYRRP